jgi:hypothetical protein
MEIGHDDQRGLGQESGPDRGVTPPGHPTPFERDALFYPGAHSVVGLARLEQLVVAGVKSIETDVMYDHGKGELYVQHPLWSDLGCKDEIQAGSPTLRDFVERVDQLRDLLSPGRATFIYLDMKDLCLTAAQQTLEDQTHAIRDKFLATLRLPYLKGAAAPLNVVWVSTGGRRWAAEALADKTLGPHLSLDEGGPCGAPPEDDADPKALACSNSMYSVSGASDAPATYLGTEGGRAQLYNPILKRAAGEQDRFPIRFYFSDDTDGAAVRKLLTPVSQARAPGARYPLHAARELYLCNNEDPAQQSLWLGATELGVAPASRQLGYNLRVQQASGGDSKGDEVAVGTEVIGRSQYIVEVHRSEGSGTTLWYSSYRRNLDSGGVELLRGTTAYDTGRRPDVALVERAGTIYAFEVHSNEASDRVWYNVLRLSTSTGELTTLAHGELTTGKRPRLAIARQPDAALIVVEHESPGGGELYLHLYRYDLAHSGASWVTLRAPYAFDTGAFPDVAALWTGGAEIEVVEVHESGGSDKDLWTTCHVFGLDGTTKSTCPSKRYDVGERPAIDMVALQDGGAPRGVLIEAHHDNDSLWYSLTTVETFRTLNALASQRAGRALLHGKYDSGQAPVVALAVTDRLAVGGRGDVVLAEAHRTQTFDLWMDSFDVSPAAHHLLW